jgi:hypothetical protein
MLARGDRQSDIASFFGVNGGRIAEISVGKKFASAAVASSNMLPPKGPYVYGDLWRQMRSALTAVRTDLANGNNNAAATKVAAALKKV